MASESYAVESIRRSKPIHKLSFFHIVSHSAGQYRKITFHIQLLLIFSDSNPTSQQLNKARLLFTFSPVNLWCKAREIRNSAVQGTSTPPINPNKIKNTWSRQSRQRRHTQSRERGRSDQLASPGSRGLRQDAVAGGVCAAGKSQGLGESTPPGEVVTPLVF